MLSVLHRQQHQTIPLPFEFILFPCDKILIVSCPTFLCVIETVLPIENSTVGMVIQVAHRKERVGQTP